MTTVQTGTRPVSAASGKSARDRILRAARRSLRTGGLPSLSTLAGEAGVSRATAYRAVASRGELLQLLEVEPDPTTRERVLAEAVTLVGAHGLAGLSMDELAERAGVSRASLYRLFPGKAALFREVVRANAPFIPVALAFADHTDDPPEELVPAIARALVRSAQGRAGLVRTLLVELTGPDVDAELARQLALSETIGPVAAYLIRQMADGRLRQMDPVLALMALVGPLMMHLVTRDLAERALGFDTPWEAVADELSSAWLRAMRPEAERRR
ncbi:MAG: helix-turn-helix domain-containing protein [Candidatus Dormibacteria bacterium]|jgi:AcrR family transcriptional regulator